MMEPARIRLAELWRRARWFGWLKFCLLIAAGLFLLSFAYWLGVALPAESRARTQLERERFEAEQRLLAEQRARDAELAAEAKNQRRACDQEAEDAFWAYMHLNGKPDPKGGSWLAPTSVWDNARGMREAKLKDCYRIAGLRME